MTRADFDAYCKTLKATTNVVQWGDSSVWKIGAKIFAICSKWGKGDGARISFKCSELSYSILIEQPDIIPAPYLARAKWVQVETADAMTDQEVRAYIDDARVKNGPALAGHGAEAVCDAIAQTITTLPEQLRRSLTWDQGAEMAQHAKLRIGTGLQVYFCDPQSPWQRGTNENTNGLLRQYFPKGTDLSAHSADEIEAVALTLNMRPRKALDWKTPAEALNQYLR